MNAIIVDMDGVLAAIHQPWIDLINKEYKTSFTKEDICTWDIHTALGLTEDIYKFLDHPGLFENAPIIEDSQEILEKLWSKYRCYICTASSYKGTTVVEKVRWLNKNYPFIKKEEIVFTKDKSLVKGSYMIDDAPHNLEVFDGFCLIYNQPWNKNYKPGWDDRHFRVYNWKEIGNFFGVR